MTATTAWLAQHGLSYRQLDYWTTRGYIVAYESNPGSGRAREWQHGELELAALMAKLVRHGMTVPAAAKLVRERQHVAREVLAVLARAA
jgi:DNA-binding transcriptional MerR regulator